MIKTVILFTLLLVGASAQAATLGPNVVADGDFSTGQGWSLGTGWQVLPGTCPVNGLSWRTEGATSAIFRAPDSPMSGGAAYRITYTVTGTLGASDPRHWVRIKGDSTVDTSIGSGDGTFTYDIVSPANVTIIGVIGVYGFSGVLDNVAVNQVNP